MAPETFPIDLAAFCEREEAQTHFLDDALATSHAGTIAGALGLIARVRGMSGLAAVTGMKRQQLYRALSADGNPTLDTLTRVMTALGYRLSAERARPDRRRDGCSG
jgi:probable addiction module antidote protein